MLEVWKKIFGNDSIFYLFCTNKNGGVMCSINTDIFSVLGTKRDSKVDWIKSQNVNSSLVWYKCHALPWPNYCMYSYHIYVFSLVLVINLVTAWMTIAASWDCLFCSLYVDVFSYFFFVTASRVRKIKRIFCK